jgi:hypothetical protein
MAAQIASRQADEDARQTRISGLALDGLKYFGYDHLAIIGILLDFGACLRPNLVFKRVALKK